MGRRNRITPCCHPNYGRDSIRHSQLFKGSTPRLFTEAPKVESAMLIPASHQAASSLKKGKRIFFRQRHNTFIL